MISMALPNSALPNSATHFTRVITAMGREAVGADLIEDGISIVVIDGLAKPIVSTLDPVQYGMNRGIREDIDMTKPTKVKVVGTFHVPST